MAVYNMSAECRVSMPIRAVSDVFVVGFDRYTDLAFFVVFGRFRFKRGRIQPLISLETKSGIISKGEKRQWLERLINCSGRHGGGARGSRVRGILSTVGGLTHGTETRKLKMCSL